MGTLSAARSRVFAGSSTPQSPWAPRDIRPCTCSCRRSALRGIPITATKSAAAAAAAHSGAVPSTSDLPSSSSSSSGSSTATTAAASSDFGILLVSELTGAPHEFDALLQANHLVASEFYPAKNTPFADAFAFNAYRMQHAAQNLGLHLNEGARGAHVTLLAASRAAKGGQQQQDKRQRQQQRSTLLWPRSTPSSGSSGGGDTNSSAVGVCNVTLRWAGETIASAAGCLVGAPFAMVTNMTVTPQWRRRGVAKQLLQSSVVTATCRLSEHPHFMALLCYKGHTAAFSLYTSFGFVPTAWVDPEWREDAEKSRVGKPRRILMVKPLRAGVLPPPVLQEGGDPVVAAEAAQQASKKSG